MNDSITKEELIMGQLSNYPNIEKLFGRKWVLNQIKSGKHHPIFDFLLEKPPDYRKINNLLGKLKETEVGSDGGMALYLQISSELGEHKGYILLNHLEKCLEKLDIIDGKHKLKSIRSNLRNENEFEDTLSEIELASLFRDNGFGIEIEPNLLGKHPDLKVKIDDRWIYIEIVTRYWRMKEKSVKEKKGLKFIELEMPKHNPVEDTILDEFDNHFADAVKSGVIGEVTPIIIVLNTTHSDIRGDMIDRSFGSWSCIIPINRKTGEVYDSYWYRMEYLFSWDKVPGNDSKRLIEFLKQKFDISWVETARIEKIDDGKTIRVSTEKNYLSLTLNDEQTELNLKIDDGRTTELMVKTENGKLFRMDGVYSRNTETSSISAILDYERIVNPDESVTLRGNLYINPYSTKNSLTKKELNLIRKCLG